MREAGTRRRVVRFLTQDPGEQYGMMRDLRKRVRQRQEGADVAIVAAALPGVAVSVRRTGTSGRAARFGNIIVSRIFFLRTSARRARQSLRHDR
jgi:hypothetical protein